LLLKTISALTPSSIQVRWQQIALGPVCLDNDVMDHRPLVIAAASALDIDDAQSGTAQRTEAPRRIRRQGPPSGRHLSLARNLQRDDWKVADADDRARRIEDSYGLQEK
jgi:hypothetical protein